MEGLGAPVADDEVTRVFCVDDGIVEAEVASAGVLGLCLVTGRENEQHYREIPLIHT